MDTIKKVVEKEKARTQGEIQNLTKQYQDRSKMVAQQDPICNKIAGAIDMLNKQLLDFDGMVDTYEQMESETPPPGDLSHDELMEKKVEEDKPSE